MTFVSGSSSELVATMPSATKACQGGTPSEFGRLSVMAEKEKMNLGWAVNGGGRHAGQQEELILCGHSW
jgi:hypothetical protein